MFSKLSVILKQFIVHVRSSEIVLEIVFLAEAMSRWDNLPSSDPIQSEQPYGDPSGVVVQTGGSFLRSQDEEPFSDFVRCFYQNKNTIGTYEIM